MFGLFFGSLIAVVSAQILVVPDNPVNINGPNVATRVKLLPGGGFRLFAAEDVDNIFYPTSPQIPPSRIIHMDAQDLVNDYYPPIGFRPPPPPPPKPFYPVMLAAEDLDDYSIVRRPFARTRPSIRRPIKKSDAEDLKNEIKWSVTVGNKDELENGGINWGEITKIAGQVHDIGKVLGFDAEDVENQVFLTMYDKRKLQECARKQRQHWEENRRKQIMQEELWHAEARLAAEKQLANKRKSISYDAEDAQNVKWSVTVGNKDELENGGINWGEITKIAGQVHDIGKVLGFDAEDAENIPIPAACAIIGAACALANTGMNIYDHVKGSDEAAELTNGGINWGEITKIAGQVHDIGKVLGFDAEDLDDWRAYVSVKGTF